MPGDFDESAPTASERRFRILGARQDSVQRDVPWALVAPHEAQAQHNHGQTLERLNERDGLTLLELYYVLHDRPFPHAHEPWVTRAEARRYLAARLEALR